MAVESFREAIRQIRAQPLLWVPGIVAGLFAAGLWLMLSYSGAFFTSRLVIFAGLILMVFITGMLVTIRDKEGSLTTLVRGGITYYFRVLLPQLVILFMLVVIFILIFVTSGFLGAAMDPGVVGMLTFCVMIPTLMLTYFFDVAAVFEDKRVFESIQRSSVLVSENLVDVITFYILCAVSSCVILFALMFTWEITLFERLAPLADYSQEQIQAFTYTEFLTILGPDGMWITAFFLFIGGVLLVPLLYSYKACFFQKLAKGALDIQQVGGEYDSKGRWYKY